MQAQVHAQTPSNFLPEDYMESRVQRRTNLFSLVLFVLVMAGISGAFAVSGQRQVDVRHRQERVNHRYQEAAARLEQLDELQSRKQQMMRKARITAGLLERVPRSLVLAELINQMPPTLSLLEMGLEARVIKMPIVAATMLEKIKAEKSRQAEEAILPPIRQSEINLDLTGVAPTDVEVAQFMTALSQSPMFSDLNLIFSQQVTVKESEVRKFRVQLRVRPDVALPTGDALLAALKLKQNPMSDRIQINPSGQLVAPGRQAISSVTETEGK